MRIVASIAWQLGSRAWALPRQPLERRLEHSGTHLVRRVHPNATGASTPPTQALVVPPAHAHAGADRAALPREAATARPVAKLVACAVHSVPVAG